MPTLRVSIQDADALASVCRSVIIDYLIEHGWRLAATIGIRAAHPGGHATRHIHTAEPTWPAIEVPTTEASDDYGAAVGRVITTLSETQGCSELEIFDDLRGIRASPPGTYPQPWDGWVCFHCGTRFREVNEAREHFGPTPDDNIAACLSTEGNIR